MEYNQNITIAVSHSNLGQGDATWYLDGWALEFINYAKSLGYQVVDISGQNLNYQRMTDILTSTRPAALFNFSHGCRTYLMGNDLKCSLTRGEPDPSCGTCEQTSNLRAITGTAIIAYSCHSAAQLGKCAIAYGSPAYVGFADNLIVVSDKYGMQDLFKEALMPMSNRILEGWTIGESVEKAREEILNAVKLYKPVELLAVGLMYDLEYLTAHGDMSWRLV